MFGDIATEMSFCTEIRCLLLSCCSFLSDAAVLTSRVLSHPPQVTVDMEIYAKDKEGCFYK